MVYIYENNFNSNQMTKKYDHELLKEEKLQFK